MAVFYSFPHLGIFSCLHGEKNGTLINVHTPLLQRPECFPNHLHPNADGARLLAEIICPHVKEHLTSSRK